MSPTPTGKEHADKYCDGVKVQVFLLFNEKQSFRKLGDIIYQQSKSGEIYVRRDALTVIFDNNRILYGNLVTYGGSGLKHLWQLVFAERSTLLGKGLVALGLQNAAIVWMNNKPKDLGDITGVYVCVCMYVCVYVCMYVCVCMCMHACVHVYVYVCMCVYVCMYICMYV